MDATSKEFLTQITTSIFNANNHYIIGIMTKKSAIGTIKAIILIEYDSYWLKKYKLSVMVITVGNGIG